MKYYYVYIHICLSDAKAYIGWSVNPKIRWRQHCAAKDNRPFYNAIRKYGKECFESQILFRTTNLEEVKKKEIEFIKQFDTLVPNGYNLTVGGEGGDTFANNPNKEVIRRKLGVLGNKNAKGHHSKRPGTSKAMKKNNPMKRPEVVAKFKGKNNSMFGKKRLDVSTRNKNPSVTEQIKRLQNRLKKLEKEN